jgi:hypothetical protein
VESFNSRPSNPYVLAMVIPSCFRVEINMTSMLEIEINVFS